MTTIYNLTIDGDRFTFLCRSRSTRNGFAHDCELQINGNFRVSHSVHYLNRTWECWTFQTAIKGALNQLWTERADELRDAYRAAHGIKRITAKHADALQAFIDEDAKLAQLDRALSRVRETYPTWD